MMLANKVCVVCGIANKKSIAWSIAKKLCSEGSKVVITYQKEEFEGKIQRLIEDELGGTKLMTSVCCDALNPIHLQTLRNTIKKEYGMINALYHCIAYAPSTALKISVKDVTLDDFTTTMTTSAYSLISLSTALLPILTNPSSITSLSFIGSERVFPEYGIMSVAKAALEATSRQLAQNYGKQGVRVNCLRSSPVNTLAARGIPGFLDMKKSFITAQPLHQVSPVDDISNWACFLASDASNGMTGQIINVDGGFGIMGCIQT